MSRLFYHVMQDNVGNLLFGVSGTMRLAGTGTLATIYGDEALTVVLPNPMTNHPSFGSFKCFLGAGDYDFYMAKAGYTFETLTGVQGHGSLAQQDTSNVTITGGSINDTVLRDMYTNVGERTFVHEVGFGTAAQAGLSIMAQYGARINGSLAVNGAAVTGKRVTLWFPKATEDALQIQPTDSDVAAGVPIAFKNVAGVTVGSIQTNATTTAYNTSSDGRLKEAVQPLADALATIQALRPVQFRWKADGSLGHGLVAQEVQQVLPGVVSGTETLGIDYSKLVPWLVATCQELAAQVQTLTARLAAAEG